MQSISSPLSISDDLADHVAAFLGVQVQLFAEGVERDFHVLDHRVAFVLVVEGLFLGPFDGVLEQVVQTTHAGRLALLDQLLAAAGHEHRLHVALGLREIEQLPAVGVAAHLDEPLASCCSGRWRGCGRGCRGAGRGRSAAARTTPSARPTILPSVCLSWPVSLRLGGGGRPAADSGFLAIRSGQGSRVQGKVLRYRVPFVLFFGCICGCFFRGRPAIAAVRSTISTLSPNSSGLRIDSAAVVELHVGLGRLRLATASSCS